MTYELQCASTSNSGGATIWRPITDYHTCRQEEAKPAMRGAYEIIVVDPETEQCTLFRVVAQDERTAQLKVVAREPRLAEHAEDYDWIIRRLGDIRAKKAGPTEVKVVP